MWYQSGADLLHGEWLALLMGCVIITFFMLPFHVAYGTVKFIFEIKKTEA